ncbi:MAG TPA: amino acid ABC transporter substrate-binding protein [Burkholderiaceae bacterium]|jgi:glutamate/aspartate transport system substrate-binding protein|nr:amino acid ABC transporter substrate-binding protein [Burkholderiaceae bacterium]
MKKSLLALAALCLAVGAAHAEDTLAKIKSSGKVVMGTRESSAPLAYTLGGGKYTGYHVELCERIIADIGKQLGIKPTIEYTPVTSQNRIPLVQNGTVDLECGSTTNNQARAQQVAFGLTTYVTEVRMAVNAKSGLTSINQLNGKTVVTTTGTTSVQLLRKHERGNGVNFNEVFGKDHADSFLILESGRADAFVMDDNILAGNIANAKNPADFKITGEVLSVEPIAVMIRKDDPSFKKAVDDSIRSMIKSGDLTKLYNKWFLSPIPPKNVSVNLPMGETLKGLLANPNDNPAEAFAKK